MLKGSGCTGLQGLFCESHTCVYVERQWMYGVYMDCSVSLIHVCMLKGSGCTVSTWIVL